MLELLSNLKKTGVLGVPSVPVVKSCTYEMRSGVPAVFQGVPEPQEHHGTPRGTPRIPDKALKLIEEHREHREKGVLALEPPDLWRERLARLDPAAPPAGCPADRWAQLVGDCLWLADRHGCNAAALGWTASDLFGLDDSHDGWGGLADRLEGARRVTLSNSVAHWRSDDLEGWLWRRTLRPMRAIWEVQKI